MHIRVKSRNRQSGADGGLSGEERKMKVPGYIRKAITECAKLNEQANFREKEIIEWMQKNKITEETAADATRNMDDSFIDCCQITNNAEIFIKLIEGL